ncbi:hypothetical protein PINS_up013571 [Pythium insidiosum]|nr:hypothetical protein PINS_up013571 [Pythium insidiosum]
MFLWTLFTVVTVGPVAEPLQRLVTDHITSGVDTFSLRSLLVASLTFGASVLVDACSELVQDLFTAVPLGRF